MRDGNDTTVLTVERALIHNRLIESGFLWTLGRKKAKIITSVIFFITDVIKRDSAGIRAVSHDVLFQALRLELLDGRGPLAESLLAHQVAQYGRSFRVLCRGFRFDYHFCHVFQAIASQ